MSRLPAMFLSTRTVLVRFLDRFSPRVGVSFEWGRRGRFLTALILATTAACLALLLYTLALSFAESRWVERPLTIAIFALTPVPLAALLILNRRGKTPAAATLYLVLVTAAIIVGAGSPGQIVQGRSTFFLVVPIIMASVILSPASSVIVAALIIGTLLVLSCWATTSVWSATAVGFLLIGLVADLSARSLEKALSMLQRANQALDWRVVDRTRDLAAAIDRVKRAEAERLQSMKLAAIGQLAAGVAHEINNPLGVILGFAQAMEHRVPENDALRLPVVSIAREAVRCKSLVQELLVFSRTNRRSSEPTSINDVVRSAVVLLEARARTLSVSLDVDLTTSPVIVMANKTQLQQVVVNLGNNALDAMPDGGTLTVKTADGSEDSVLLEVSDTGSGIPEEIRPRIFEPFFTTKEVGKGTGLGLSLVHEIVAQHAGSIAVESQSGMGTRFRVLFSRAQGTSRPSAPGGEP